EHYKQAIPTTDILVRGDSGFATPHIYELCEKYDNHFVIRLKHNNKLYQLAEEFILYDNNHPWDEKEEYYYSVPYQDGSWSKSRRVCIRSTRDVGELLFSHAFIVTNFSDNVSSERVFETYQNVDRWKTTLKKLKIAFTLTKQIVLILL